MPGKSQVRHNAEQDPTYRPYCLRCSTMVRMAIVAPFYWRCACGAEHDERLASPALGGIEWFTIRRAEGAGSSPQFVGDEDCQCARCGSSVDFRDCTQCDHGFVERDAGDGIVPDLYDAPCEWCHGTGGSLHCLSSPEWCAANPLPGRAHIESTALRAGADSAAPRSGDGDPTPPSAPSWFALSQELSDELTRTKAALASQRAARARAEQEVAGACIAIAESVADSAGPQSRTYEAAMRIANAIRALAGQPEAVSE